MLELNKLTTEARNPGTAGLDTMTPLEIDQQAVNTLRTGQKLQNQNFTELVGVFRDNARGGLTRDTHSDCRTNSR